jgi:hypothetical protein
MKRDGINTFFEIKKPELVTLKLILFCFKKLIANLKVKNIMINLIADF